MDTLTLSFQLKISKKRTDGKAPIYLRITIDCERMEFSSKQFIEVSKWDNNRQEVKGKSEEAKVINYYLSELKLKTQREFNYLLQTNEHVKIEDLKNALEGKKPKAKTLIEVFEENNQLMQKEVGVKHVKKTMQRYETCLERLKEFLKSDIADENISLDELDLKFMKRFDSFLSTKYNLDYNGVMGYLKKFKKVIHQAMAFGYIKHDPFFGYKTSYRDINRVFLSQEEIDRIKTKELKIPRLDLTRDIFVFACYTGISYSDLKELTPNHIQTGINGSKMIVLERRKTRVRAVIPILSETKAIIEKYANHPECVTTNKLLPVKSNQKLNAYLVEIADLCEISKTITMHIGRHSFASTVTLSNNVPVETVQKMLGHKNIAMTMRYAKVVDNKVAADMKKLDERLEQVG